MDTNNNTKLKWLLNQHVPGTLYLASWLEAHGISRELQKRYIKSGWFERLGHGAFQRTGEEVSWEAALYTIQTQSDVPVHAGGLSALGLLGYAHYLRMQEEKLWLFMPLQARLPSWFLMHDWGSDVSDQKTSMLPRDVGLSKYDVGNFEISISSAERAIMECLYLSPKKMSLVECYEIMEGLSTLRPRLLQKLLGKCRSIKVKRLFLYMAERAGHAWFQRLDLDQVNIGKGDREIVKGGSYVAKYGLMLPKELV